MAFWNRFKKASDDEAWKQIEQTPIPVGAGRIWLADRDGNVVRAMAWTWRVIEGREPGKYLHWMTRAPHAKQPPAEAMKQLAAGN
ncbi:hypothetical protein [Bradyrhizobium lablabi]|uniref:hypothetical protein n=1 Tax=Bradyrhizobium lablabi TaxID=722472 RepID=UPI001BAD2539|nr:hypothetical protein [Bradyrhizobium lablabi]MBR0691941.1 hypothetical protein [Bradyrhizobium lablabi]